MPNTKSYRRTRNLFDPKSKASFRLSRSRLENFMRCPRCFYLDRRLGIGQPSMPTFTLNLAVDSLLKKEFDFYRQKGETHPLMHKYNIDAVPFKHCMIDDWRENFKGVRHHHKPTNLVIFGAIDDLWIDKKGNLFVVDYKSTSTTGPITLDGIYKQAYKRQMEIYQWLLRKNKLEVSDTGYFIFCNADKKNDFFEAQLKFDMEIISYKGNADWVEPVIIKAHECLMSEDIPDYNDDCEYCCYRQAMNDVECKHKKEKDSNLKSEAQRELF